MPPSSSSESDSEDDDRKPKGAEGMIEVENPNLAVKKNKKVSQLDKETSSKGATKGATAKPEGSKYARSHLTLVRFLKC